MPDIQSGQMRKSAGNNHYPEQSTEGDLELELMLELAEMGVKTATGIFYTFNKLSWL